MCRPRIGLEERNQKDHNDSIKRVFHNWYTLCFWSQGSLMLLSLVKHFCCCNCLSELKPVSLVHALRERFAHNCNSWRFSKLCRCVSCWYSCNAAESVAAKHSSVQRKIYRKMVTQQKEIAWKLSGSITTRRPVAPHPGSHNRCFL